MKQEKRRWLPGVILTVVLTALESVFMVLLTRTGLVPGQYLLIGGGVLLVLTAVVFLLVFNCRRKVRFTLGCILAAVIVALLGIAGYYIEHGFSTLEEITVPEVEETAVGVYVPTDDPATVIEDAKEYTFGILAQLDRDNTDRALVQLQELLGQAVTTVEYAGLSELVDGLLADGEVDALLLGEAFFDLLDELEGYTEAQDQLRLLHSLIVKETDETTPPPTEPEPEPVPEVDDKVFTLYISGIDCSGSVSRRSRSDVNILATVNTETRQILLVSTPRDYYVPLSISSGIPDKLTHAGIYGVGVSMDTLEMLYDTEIDYYFRLNFDGFQDIIDALGGVSVYSQYAFKSRGEYFEKGYNQLDGESALKFARARYTVPGGDRQRGRNQMAVITAVIDKASSPALLKNYAQIMNSVKGSFETSMPYDLIAAIVRQQLSDGRDWNVVSYSVDGTGASRRPYSLSTNAYVMIPDLSTIEQAQTLMQQVRDGETPDLNGETKDTETDDGDTEEE